MRLLLQNPQAREFLFAELAQLTESAVPMTRVAEIMANRRNGDVRAFGKTLQQGLSRNMTLPDAMRANFEPMEYAVVSAADASGQLPEGFRHLSGYYQLLAGTRRNIIAAIAYPVVVLHAACLVHALLVSLQGSGGFVELAVRNLGMLWVVLGVWLVVCVVFDKLAASSVLVDRLLGMIPMTGKARKALALSRWCLAAHFQMLAGRNFVQAFTEGGKASRSAVLEAFSQHAAQQAKEGKEIGPVFLRSSAVPEAFAGGVASAEIAGRMDELLAQWCERFQADARFALTSLVTWLPKLVFMLAAAAVIYVVFSYTKAQMGQLERFSSGNI